MIPRLTIAAGLIGLTAACSRPSAPPSAAPPPPAGAVVQIEDLPATIAVEGTVAARRRAEIATRLMARIAAVPVDAGSRVRVGDVLVHLDLGDIDANRARAAAGARAAAAAKDEAARQAARMDTLLAGDVVPQAQRDAAHLGLTQAEAQLALAQAGLREVETAAGYATILAPFAGRVVSREVDEGDMASPGVTLVVLEEDGPRDGVFAVPADLAPGLRPGVRIRVTAGDRTTDAPVRVLAAAADRATRTVELRVVLPSDWPSGTVATAMVPAGATRGIAVPEAVVVRRGQLTGVRVVTPSGVGLRWVRLGRALADSAGAPRRVEVLSGLDAGERIAP